jgi:hypothetical protein
MNETITRELNKQPVVDVATKRDARDKAATEFNTHFWAHVRSHLDEPLSSKVYLFSQCLRIVAARDIVETSFTREESAKVDYLDWDSIVSTAEDLFEHAYLSNVLNSESAELWALKEAQEDASREFLATRRNQNK